MTVHDGQECNWGFDGRGWVGKWGERACGLWLNQRYEEKTIPIPYFPMLSFCDIGLVQLGHLQPRTETCYEQTSPRHEKHANCLRYVFVGLLSVQSFHWYVRALWHCGYRGSVPCINASQSALKCKAKTRELAHRMCTHQPSWTIWSWLRYSIQSKQALLLMFLPAYLASIPHNTALERWMRAKKNSVLCLHRWASPNKQKKTLVNGGAIFGHDCILSLCLFLVHGRLPSKRTDSDKQHRHSSSLPPNNMSIKGRQASGGYACFGWAQETNEN